MSKVRFVNIPTEIHNFRTGDVIPVDGPSGTAKMTKDNLLKETAKKALAEIKNIPTTATEADLTTGNYTVVDTPEGPKKLPGDVIAPKSGSTAEIHKLPNKNEGYLVLNDSNESGKMNVGSIFNNFANKFEPQSTNAKLNQIYIHEGVLYLSKSNHYGDWRPSYFDATSISAWVEKCLGLSGLDNIFNLYRQNIDLANYSIGDVVDLTTAEIAGYTCGVADISEGDYVVLSSRGGNNPRAWAFLDTDKKMIEMAPAQCISNFRIIQAPKNARYVVVNNNLQYSEGDGVVINQSLILKNAGYFKDFARNLFKNELLGKTNYGYAINTGSVAIGRQVGMTPSVNNDYAYAVLQCSEGDSFKILSRTMSNLYRAWAFVDIYGKMITKADIDADANTTEKIVVAPKYASTLIVNFSINYDNDVRVIRNSDNLFYGAGTNQNISVGSYNIGDVVDLTPGSVAGYYYKIVPCSYGDRFVVTLRGGTNPRAYAFLDSDNHLLAVSYAAYYGNGSVIRAPFGATKLLVQTNTDVTPYVVVDKVKDSFAKTILHKDIKNLSGLIGGSDYIWTKLSAIKNGKGFRDELENAVTTFEKPGDLMVHVSTHKIINGVVYMTYYANTRSASEEPTEHTARFVYAPLNDLSNKTYVDIMDVGETFDGKPVNAIYDTIFATIDDDTLFIMWTAMLGSSYCRLYKTYTISTGVYSDTAYNNLKIGSEVVVWSDLGMKLALRRNNIDYQYVSGDIGLMQKMTSIVENGDTYYYTGAYCRNLCFIVRSKDMITWEYIDQPPFENMARWENACFIKGDWLYYSCRQDFSEGSSFLTRFNLKTRQWDKVIYLADCQSRNDFFERAGTLYLVYAPKSRNHIAILRINEDCLENSDLIQDAVLTTPSFYPYVTLSGNTLYMSYTQNRQHIVLSYFTIRAVVSDKIIQDVVFGLFE